jgi:hypothetical protein
MLKFQKSLHRHSIYDIEYDHYQFELFWNSRLLVRSNFYKSLFFIQIFFDWQHDNVCSNIWDASTALTAYEWVCYIVKIFTAAFYWFTIKVVCIKGNKILSIFLLLTVAASIFLYGITISMMFVRQVFCVVNKPF